MATHAVLGRCTLFPFCLFPISFFVLASHAASHDDLLVDALVNNLTHPSQPIRLEALKALEELKNPATVPAFIELLRFNNLFGISTVPALETVTGAKLGDDWSKWVEWLQQHEEIHPNRSFLAWKANMYSRIDPAFENFLYVAE